MTRRQWRAERKRIWRDMSGCACTRTIVVDGKAVMVGRDEMCTPDAIRCNGRLKRWARDAKKLGPEPATRSGGSDGR